MLSLSKNSQQSRCLGQRIELRLSTDDVPVQLRRGTIEKGHSQAEIPALHEYCTALDASLMSLTIGLTDP